MNEAARQRDEVREVVAGNLRALKARQRVTDKEIGQAIGMSGSAVNERMRGVASCSATDLVVFAEYFGVAVQDLFGAGPADNPRYENGISVVTPLSGQMELFLPDSDMMSERLRSVKNGVPMLYEVTDSTGRPVAWTDRENIAREWADAFGGSYYSRPSQHAAA